MPMRKGLPILRWPRRRARRTRQGGGAGNPQPTRHMNKDEKFARVAALRPARRKEPLALPPPVLEPIEGADRLSVLLGARVKRNHYGEHLSLQQWYATPEICTPDPRSLSLLLPQANTSEDDLNVAID